MWQKVVEIIGHHVEPFSATAEAAEQVVIDLGIYWNSDAGASNKTLLWGRFERRVSAQSHRSDNRSVFLFLKTDERETLSVEQTSFQAESIHFCCNLLTFE